MAIVVIGTIFVDVKGYPLGAFIPDGRNPGRMAVVHGGVARNVAEDLGRLGLSPVFVGLTDRSALAGDVRTRLAKSGVNTRFMFESNSGMGTWMAIFNDKGDVAANISVRPDLSPLTACLDAHHRDIFEPADSIILEIDIEEETVERVFQYAEQYGKRVTAMVSVMSIALQRRRFFSRTGCLICNLQEAGMLAEAAGLFAGEKFASLPLSDLEQSVGALARAEGLSRLIVTLSERGAVYADCSGATGWCPAQKVDLVDSTGAGDSFCAGAAAALTAGAHLAEAARVGNALAATVITDTENVCPVMKPEEIGLTPYNH